jgi:sirohydrochlorin ferrochelatase
VGGEVTSQGMTGPAQQQQQGTTALIVFAHGSPVAEANQGIAALARSVETAGVADFAMAAFLDCAEPTLGQAVDEAAGRGATRVIVMPYFLTTGLHLRRDLPRLVEEARARFPQVEVVVTGSLEGHPRMAEAIVDRVKEACGAPSRAPGAPAAPAAGAKIDSRVDG